MRLLAASVALYTLMAFSALASDRMEDVEPLVTKEKIEEVARRCGAEVSVSFVPGYDEDTDTVMEYGTLMVGVRRTNSPEAIQCVSNNIPTVVTMPVGRALGVPPLDQETLQSVLKECDWTAEDGTVALGTDDELQLQPHPDAEYERVEFVITALRPYAPRIGFVGNERYAREESE